MSSRPPAPPPRLNGFQHVRHLGSGGFADVYLYEEQLLGRKVAVKVLLSDKLGADAIRLFTNEANLMAQLSNHPSIVSVYQAGVSEDGSPYIVMEYCSRPNLQARCRAARFSQAEALRVGVQIAGAVETAHRAGILHRDIKPANILFTDYGRPALTDFGIAATTGSGSHTGMSVPWAPPESLAADGQGDQRADIYSLAATIYTLLAGRSPFELPGASNTSVDLMGRIQSMPLPPIGRQDVSASLERVLAAGMAKRPEGRQATAMQFARDLQRVQIELGMQPTTVDVVEEAPEAVDEEDDGGFTRIRSVMTIEAQPARPVPVTTPMPTTPLPGPTVDAAVDATQLRGGFRPAPVEPPAAPPVADTAVRAQAVSPEPEAVDVRRPRLTGVLAGVAAVVVVGAAAAALVLTGNPNGTSAPSSPATAAPVDLPAGPPPDLEDVTGTVLDSGRVAFTWHNPDPQNGDRYRWRRDEAGVEHDWDVVEQPEVTVEAAAAGLTCIEVFLWRADGSYGREPAKGCAP